MAQYDPVQHADWAAGEPVPYLHLARAFQAVDSTTKRLKIADALVNMFRWVAGSLHSRLCPCQRDDMLSTHLWVCRCCQVAVAQAPHADADSVSHSLTTCCSHNQHRSQTTQDSCNLPDEPLAPPHHHRPPLLRRSVLALTPEDLLPAAYLACGRIAPDHQGLELSVGGSTVAAALVASTGVARGRLREMYATMGDLGDVAQVGGAGVVLAAVLLDQLVA